MRRRGQGFHGPLVPLRAEIASDSAATGERYPRWVAAVCTPRSLPFRRDLQVARRAASDHHEIPAPEPSYWDVARVRLLTDAGMRQYKSDNAVS